MPLKELIQNKKINLSQLVNFVILVVAALVALNIFRTQNRKIAQIHEIRHEQIKKNEILLRLGDLQKRIEQYKQEYKPQDRREIINTITGLAATSGIKVVSIKPQERSLGRVASSKIYGKTFFSLVIEVSNYRQLGEFISSLESNAVMFIIESIQVKRSETMQSDAVSRPDKLQVELFISELFFKD